MSVFRDFVAISTWPPDASTGPGAKLIGPIRERWPPRTSLEPMVPNEEYVELSDLFFSTRRTTAIG